MLHYSAPSILNCSHILQRFSCNMIKRMQNVVQKRSTKILKLNLLYICKLPRCKQDRRRTWKKLSFCHKLKFSNSYISLQSYCVSLGHFKFGLFNLIDVILWYLENYEIERRLFESSYNLKSIISMIYAIWQCKQTHFNKLVI